MLKELLRDFLIALSCLLRDAHLVILLVVLQTLEELLELRLRAGLIDEVLQVNLVLAHVLVVRVEEDLRDLVAEVVEVIFLEKVLEVEQLLWGVELLRVAQFLEAEARVRRWLE